MRKIFDNERRSKKHRISGTLYFEDVYVGQRFVSKSRTVTEADLIHFSSLSWDHNRIHTDVEYAKGSVFGKRVVHGLLGIAMHSGLTYQLVEESLIAFLGLTWEFKKPIYIGDTIHVEQTVSDLRETAKKDRGIVIFEKEIINQRNEVVQTGSTKILLAKKAYSFKNGT